MARLQTDFATDCSPFGYTPRLEAYFLKEHHARRNSQLMRSPNDKLNIKNFVSIIIHVPIFMTSLSCWLARMHVTR